MNDKCGLVNLANPCRCARKANGFMRNGWLDAHHLQFSKDRIAAVRDVAADRLDELQALDRQHAELYRLHPFLAGPDLAQKFRETLTQSGLTGIDLLWGERPREPLYRSATVSQTSRSNVVSKKVFRSACDSVSDDLAAAGFQHRRAPGPYFVARTVTRAISVGLYL